MSADKVSYRNPDRMNQIVETPDVKNKISHIGGRHLEETGIKTKLLGSEGATQHMEEEDINMTKEETGRK